MSTLLRGRKPHVEPVLLAADIALWIGGAYRIGIVLG
jgi:hypothetical protein